jgi:hypothetical protein
LRHFGYLQAMYQYRYRVALVSQAIFRVSRQGR